MGFWLRQIRLRRWLFLRRRLKMAAFGLTHRHCATCGYPKGLNTHRLCYGCQWRNLQRALWDYCEPGDRTHIEDEQGAVE